MLAATEDAGMRNRGSRTIVSWRVATPAEAQVAEIEPDYAPEIVEVAVLEAPGKLASQTPRTGESASAGTVPGNFSKPDDYILMRHNVYSTCVKQKWRRMCRSLSDQSNRGETPLNSIAHY